ncbi:MAG: quinone-dependent dihydroorotate dehydrogenase [Alphaproteobacteria bacterium]|nr:quinone-dependent dihydroorotate dehydrogenase [Alphaproteobacteria bacterium]
MDYYRLIGPLLRKTPAETAHTLALWALAHGMIPPARNIPYPTLHTKLWGLEFPNPVGMAAGFDKDAQAVDALLAQGFGFTEAGTVTPRPQPGNPTPRLFRLEEDAAIINRMGFNNRGLEAFVRSLRGQQRKGIVGINLGKNKDSTDAIADYVKGLAQVYALADYITINISSPNTPGLRDLQGRQAMESLFRELLGARKTLAMESGRTVPLLVKIAPDMDEAGFSDVAEVASGLPIDGIIVSNTTLARPPSLRSHHRAEAGGLSGKPLFEHSTAALRAMYRLTGGKIPLIGVGGIASAEDAYAKIRAGASLVQIYTAFVYQGFGLIGGICSGLAVRLETDGFASLRDAVGVDAR